ncbi:hypothetical protein FIBSPDRAFT_880944 [Athelia psychrophila]|uniref:Uncharacterized protein n=1 Tax=Athelia psychrophila TaxID=1759441 RepID=A0A166X3Y3_9AGAM|nr:hypothetical protein FIBSPDRAFT_880944 [Fibularhizoctonia sp. CBS 109695]
MLLRVHWYKVELIIDNDEHTGSVVAVDSWDKHLGPGGVHIGEGGGGGVMGLGVESMRDLNQYLKSKLILLGNSKSGGKIHGHSLGTKVSQSGEIVKHALTKHKSNTRDSHYLLHNISLSLVVSQRVVKNKTDQARLARGTCRATAAVEIPSATKSNTKGLRWRSGGDEGDDGYNGDERESMEMHREGSGDGRLGG